MSSDLRIITSVDDQKLQFLLAQQADIEAQIASLLPHSAPLASSSSSSSSAFQQHRIHKPQQHRRSNGPRSQSSNGTTMSRLLSSDRIEVPTQRTRTLSQCSAPPMARANSRGTSSARTPNVPFTSTVAMPPPMLSESRRDNPAMDAWARDQSQSYWTTVSHQSPQLQRSISLRTPDLEQVPELGNVGESPDDFLYRIGTGLIGTPSLSVTPSPISIPSSTTPNRDRKSTSSRHHFAIAMPNTPTSGSLTTATTLASEMSRQNSLCNEPLLESIQMMKFNSNTSFSTDHNPLDHTLFDQVPPHYPSSHSHRSSNEEQCKLLAGAGGASHVSQFSRSFSAADAVTAFQSSGSFGEKMEKCQSNESTSSSSSSLSSSRNMTRLQDQIYLAAARPLMPKGGSDGNTMSRDNSSQSMARLDSKDGSQAKLAISKPTYQRPKHDRVYCNLCDDHPEGFRGDHELRRHQDRLHKLMVKKWVCVEPSGHGHPKPFLPLSRCKACGKQKKRYNVYYNAAAHLRRTHFKEKSKGRKNSKTDETDKRGGNATSDPKWPPMEELKYWMMEVEEPLTENTQSGAQQEADDSEGEGFDPTFDEPLSSARAIGNMAGGSFDSSFITSDTSAMFDIYPSPSTQAYGLHGMDLDISTQQSIDSSITYASSQTSFDNFSPFQNDNLSFLEHSSIPQTFDDQSLGLGLDFVDPLYL